MTVFLSYEKLGKFMDTNVLMMAGVTHVRRVRPIPEYQGTRVLAYVLSRKSQTNSWMPR